MGGRELLVQNLYGRSGEELSFLAALWYVLRGGARYLCQEMDGLVWWRDRDPASQSISADPVKDKIDTTPSSVERLPESEQSLS